MKTLSICISTYNRSEKILKLVNTILSVDDNRFDVIVSDDCSSDDTIEKLKEIRDNRLKLFRNEHNMGPKKNWYQTIDRGDAQYVLHILDRDMIKACYIKDIISVLENSKAGFGYIGKYASGSYNDKSKLSEYIYPKGADAMMEFGCTLVHPTGFFIKKKCWDSIDDKFLFFSENFESIYPHSYLYMCLAEKENGLALRWNAFDTDEYSNIGKYKSSFYSREKSTGWWFPQARINEFFCLARYVITCGLEQELEEDILVNRFRTILSYATLDYLFLSMDMKNSRHYGYKTEKIEVEELININQNFTDMFIKFLDTQKGTDHRAFEKIIKIRDANITEIKQQYDFSGKLMNSQKYSTLVEAWLDLKLQGICLADKLIEEGIRNVAIYGNGRLGQKLYLELKKKINVAYVIDKQADIMREEIPVLHIEDELPQIDLIIISVLNYNEDITELLGQKGFDNVVSLEDVIYDCYI